MVGGVHESPEEAKSSLATKKSAKIVVGKSSHPCRIKTATSSRTSVCKSQSKRACRWTQWAEVQVAI